MSDKKVKERSLAAKSGFAKGGSADRSKKINTAVKGAGQVTVISVVICALVVGVIMLTVSLAVKNLFPTKPSSVTVCYGDLAVKTERELVYNGAAVCVDMNCVSDMLSLVIVRDGSNVTYSTKSGERIDLTVGESTACVNGIRFSLQSKTRDVMGKIFVSSEVIDMFISDTTVVVSEDKSTVSVITLITDPASITFSPKKSEGMSQMGKPSSMPKETSYHPEGIN